MKWAAVCAAGAFLPGALSWGSFGHITVAYIAQNLVSDNTAVYFQGLLRNDSTDYLAGIATWADTIRYTKWGHYTGVFHFIDAKDDPPHSCTVDLERDCKLEGCVVSAIQNYTTRVMDTALPAWERNQAARFIVHFIGDVHQPLHDEDVSRGGNGIHVRFEGVELNLHHVWDSSIAEKIVGGVRRKPYDEAKAWAAVLTNEILWGKFKAASMDWTAGMDLGDPTSSALLWAREGNSYVCSHVLPKGPAAIENEELGTDYYLKAAPVVEIQVARAGYRLAAWLDRIAATAMSPTDEL